MTTTIADGYVYTAPKLYRSGRVMVARSVTLQGRPWLVFFRDFSGDPWRLYRAHKTRREAIASYGTPLESSGA